MEIRVRRAAEADLPAVYNVWRTTAHHGRPLAAPPILPLFQHELTTGHMWVAEGEEGLAGFAALLVRDQIAFLAELFVLPQLQSRGIGGALMREVLAVPAAEHCTMSSQDGRALALYVRAGMRPFWPHFLLTGPSSMPVLVPSGDLTVVPADPLDPDLVAWDARIGGRRRPEDHAFLLRFLHASPLWFKRGGTTVGYGYVWRRAGEGRSGDRAGVGPLGVEDSRDAVACLGAALRWHESQIGAMMHYIAVPGPHPALTPLLRGGFRITGVETFCCSRIDLFFDPKAYLAPAGPEGTSIF